MKIKIISVILAAFLGVFCIKADDLKANVVGKSLMEVAVENLTITGNPVTSEVLKEG